MTSVVIEHLEMPASTREARAMSSAHQRVADVLAGRRVWCTSALPSCARAVDELWTCLDGAGPGVSANRVDVGVGEQLSRVADEVERMLDGASAARVFGAAERALFSEAAEDGDGLLPDAVGPGDVVVAHDGVSATVARAARERGAHAVWRIRASRRSRATPREALEFLRGFTTGVDAYVLRWLERGHRAEVIERVAAVMPSTNVVAVKESAGAGDLHQLVWRMAYAEIVRSDREESVGGTLHPRPAVAAR